MRRGTLGYSNSAPSASLDAPRGHSVTTTGAGIAGAPVFISGVPSDAHIGSNTQPRDLLPERTEGLADDPYASPATLRIFRETAEALPIQHGQGVFWQGAPIFSLSLSSSPACKPS